MNLSSVPGRVPWRRGRPPTPVFWPREFRGQYSPRGRKESDTTERLSLRFTSQNRNGLTDLEKRLLAKGERGWGRAGPGGCDEPRPTAAGRADEQRSPTVPHRG